jgi:hypothetical protein
MSQTLNPTPSITASITSTSHVFAASTTLTQLPSVSYNLIPSGSASPNSYSYTNSPYSSPSVYRPISSSPSIVFPVITNDDNVTFSKMYFIYVGVPVGLLLLCLFGYIMEIRQKNKNLKRLREISSVQTTNVARVPLNRIPPFSGV